MGVGRIFKRRWKRTDGTSAESKFFSVGFPYQGRERVESAKDQNGQKAMTETQARQYLRRRLEEIGRGEYVPGENRLYFTDLVELLKADYAANNRRSLTAALERLKPVENFFGAYKAKAITSARIKAYATARLGDGAVRATVNGELRYLRRLLRLGLATAPSVELFEGENRRQGFVDPGDFQGLLGNFQDQDVADLVEFLYHTGWRVNTGKGLEWRDVSFERSTVTMRAELSKNKEPLELPFLGEMEAVLKRRLAKRRLDCPFVFHRSGRPIRDFRHEWEQATAAAGLAGLLVHDLCRSAARNLSRAGINETVASRFMNRKTLAIYKQYRVVDSGDLRQAAQSLENYLALAGQSAKIRSLK